MCFYLRNSYVYFFTYLYKIPCSIWFKAKSVDLQPGSAHQDGAQTLGCPVSYVLLVIVASPVKVVISINSSPRFLVYATDIRPLAWLTCVNDDWLIIDLVSASLIQPNFLYPNYLAVTFQCSWLPSTQNRKWVISPHHSVGSWSKLFCG